MNIAESRLGNRGRVVGAAKSAHEMCTFVILIRQPRCGTLSLDLLQCFSDEPSTKTGAGENVSCSILPSGCSRNRAAWKGLESISAMSEWACLRLRIYP